MSIETVNHPHDQIQNTPSLTTRRLLLRRFTKNDAPALLRILSDKDVNTFLPMFPLQRMDEARAFLYKNYLDTYARPWGCRYAICLKSDPIPIGYINVADDDSHDFGHGLAREFWHQGIITEAGQAVIAQLRQWPVPYITATHDIRNPHSGGVMKNLGMTYRYSYEEQWQPKDIKVTFRMYQLNLDGNDDRVFMKYWDQYPVHFIEQL